MRLFVPFFEVNMVTKPNTMCSHLVAIVNAKQMLLMLDQSKRTWKLLLITPDLSADCTQANLVCGRTEVPHFVIVSLTKQCFILFVV